MNALTVENTLFKNLVTLWLTFESHALLKQINILMHELAVHFLKLVYIYCFFKLKSIVLLSSSSDGQG